MDTALFASASLFMGLGLWLLLAATNNFMDKNTNTILLHRMYSMIDIKNDGDLGVRLLSRSMSSLRFVKIVLNGGIIIEYLISLALIVSSILVGSLAFGVEIVPKITVIVIASLSLTAYTMFWFAFLISGLWFAYWIKLGEVQLVHFTLLTLSIISQILFQIAII